VHAPRATDRAARVIRAWRYPAYWAEQSFLEALGGEDRVWGSSVAEVKEARAAAADARASVLDPRFATTFVIGPYQPSDVVPSFEKRFGKGAPGPARPLAAPRVPAVPDGVELYAPLADTGLADVTARCVVDVGAGDAGRRYAVSRVASVLLNHAAAELLRGQSQAAYAVGAEVDWSDDAGAWIARIGALVAPSDAGFGVRQLRASAAAAAQATPNEVLSAIAAARAELRPGSTLDAAGLIEDLLALGLDAPAIASLDASFASVTAADVSRALGACVSGARVAVTAPEAAVRPSLDAAGFAPQTVPWRDQQRAQTDALAGRWAKEEQGWRERHPAR
jgi:predicted Zn-dependent peptidase